jgi:hypothetical protein
MANIPRSATSVPWKNHVGHSQTINDRRGTSHLQSFRPSVNALSSVPEYWKTPTPVDRKTCGSLSH